MIAHGIDGDVGILTGHAPLLAQLAIGPLQIQREDGEWVKAVVDGGFLHVSTEEGATRVGRAGDERATRDRDRRRRGADAPGGAPRVRMTTRTTRSRGRRPGSR